MLPANTLQEGKVYPLSLFFHVPIAMLNAVPFRKESICLARNEASRCGELLSGKVRSRWERAFDAREEKPEFPDHGLRAKGSTICGEENI